MAYNSSHTGAQHDGYVTKADLINLIYPVGSVYISLNSTSPATLFGGTWEQITGRFLLATGTCATNSDNSYFGSIKAAGVWNAPAGSTGGEDWHGLTVAEMPAHKHNFSNQYGATGPNIYGAYITISGSSNVVCAPYHAYSGNTNCLTQLDTGGSGNHNNMPPYLAVYMWKRTA